MKTSIAVMTTITITSPWPNNTASIAILSPVYFPEFFISFSFDQIEV